MSALSALWRRLVSLLRAMFGGSNDNNHDPLATVAGYGDFVQMEETE